MWWIKARIKRYVEEVLKGVPIDGPSEERLSKLERKVGEIERSLACIEKFGYHDWAYVKRGCPGAWTYQYEFRCSVCGHTRWFHWDELTKSEQEALHKLGLGEEE